jgi:predicted amidohydrolase
MEDLRVTLIQSALVWENPAANRQQFAQRIAELEGPTDLIILPEMFTTGFTMNAAPVAEDMEGETMQWLRNMAQQSQAVVTGSFIAKENDLFYNRLVWMQPDGTYQKYDKRHLFTLASEQLYYAPGQERLIVTWKGWKIMPLICYDLRFPVWSRNVEGYDLLIYVANFPERRAYAWQQLLIARAIENQAYTIGVNCVGVDGKENTYSGDSALHDFEGQTIYRITHAEDVFTTTLSASAQQIFRQKLAFLNDQDAFSIR